MTHFKKDWMDLLSNRLLSNKRVVIKSNLLPSLLVHMVRLGQQDKRVNVSNVKTHSIINIIEAL